MCGICGILTPVADDALVRSVHMMADTLHHRGPDDAGVWADQDAGVALGHRRLAILDVSEAGAQPMESVCGRYILVFNGEIYNHLTLRANLEAANAAPAWRGSSDTETLLAAVIHWGLQSTLQRAHGMFALALWDRKAQQLNLARDRMGEKPLYIARIGSGWAFASELKALLDVPGFEARISNDAVAAYLAYAYVPETLCIFEHVQKVPPGLVMSLSPIKADPETKAYETFNDLLDRGLVDRALGGSKPLDQLETTLEDVVGEQMLSDVPLGCFLSGGIDSSLIAALMQSRSTQKVRTFSIGFSEARFNEAPHAAAVAQHLKTDHAEFILSEEDALKVIADLPEIYDEPFADSSQIPTVLLCREARKTVTVALTGDGGDEIFGGYNRHISGPRLASALHRLPSSLRRATGRGITACLQGRAVEDGRLRRLAARLKLPVTALDKAAMLAPHLGEIEDLQSLYRYFTRANKDPAWLLRNAVPVVDPQPEFPVGGSEWLMAMDSVTYLPGDILVKVDRAAMATSLETRAPFLDARVVAAAWGLPPEMKIAHGKGKQALRALLDRHVPRELIDRPKQGFAIPIDRWLRGALRNWAESLLQEGTLVDLAGLNPVALDDMWTRHQSSRANNGARLWTVLMLLDWLKRYRHHLIIPHLAEKELT